MTPEYNPDEPRDRESIRNMLAGARRYELIAACMEMARMYQTPVRQMIGRPADAFEVFKDLAVLRVEQLCMLSLDSSNGMIARDMLTQGGLNITRSAPRDIFRPAIIHGALGIVLGHNHPSGSLTASQEDLEFTRSVVRAGELLGIDLYDHLIIGRNEAGQPAYTSIKEAGLL